MTKDRNTRIIPHWLADELGLNKPRDVRPSEQFGKIKLGKRPRALIGHPIVDVKPGSGGWGAAIRRWRNRHVAQEHKLVRRRRRPHGRQRR